MTAEALLCRMYLGWTLAPLRPIEPFGATYVYVDLAGSDTSSEVTLAVDWDDELIDTHEAAVATGVPDVVEVDEPAVAVGAAQLALDADHDVAEVHHAWILNENLDLQRLGQIGRAHV